MGTINRATGVGTGCGVGQMRGPCAQYISLKEIRESNKDDSQAQIDGFYLCRMRLTIP